jgi:CO/xanthine dehydrogenase Mo-binding subunit
MSVFAERTGPGSPAFAARRMAITPGFERVELVMDPSGFLEARIGSSPHGQGLKTTLAQLIAARSASRLTRSGSSPATPTAAPTAGAPSRAVR